jgi:enoyl-CoA hydratase
MPDRPTVRVEHDGPLSWIVLDRPDHANSLSAEMLDEFTEGLESLRHEGGPVLAIRGEGRGFCSGYDIGEVGAPREADPVGDRARLRANTERWLAIWDHPKPVIAAVHGYCLAGATQMCVYADLTIVAEDARIGEPAVPLGGGYIAPMWAPLVGPKRAKELAFLPGNSIDGRTAVEWGWANHAVPADSLLDTVRALAERIALVPSDVLALKKASVNRAMEVMGTRTAAMAGAEMDALLHLSPAVLAVRDDIRAQGLKDVIGAYRGASSHDIVASAHSAEERS